jgi:hypothetical protein
VECGIGPTRLSQLSLRGWLRDVVNVKKSVKERLWILIAAWDLGSAIWDRAQKLYDIAKKATYENDDDNVASPHSSLDYLRLSFTLNSSSAFNEKRNANSMEWPLMVVHWFKLPGGREDTTSKKRTTMCCLILADGYQQREISVCASKTGKSH